MVVYPAVSRAHLLRYRAVQGLELINNALKHAFPDGMKGVLTVSFTVSNNNYIAEFKDDGIGIAQGQAPDGFGTPECSRHRTSHGRIANLSTRTSVKHSPGHHVAACDPGMR